MLTRAVVPELAPGAPVVDLTHGVAPFDVRAGALTLSRTVGHLGPGVVMAVVDPGVGSDRRAVAVAVARRPGRSPAGRPAVLRWSPLSGRARQRASGLGHRRPGGAVSAVALTPSGRPTARARWGPPSTAGISSGRWRPGCGRGPTSTMSVCRSIPTACPAPATRWPAGVGRGGGGRGASGSTVSATRRWPLGPTRLGRRGSRRRWRSGRGRRPPGRRVGSFAELGPGRIGADGRRQRSAGPGVSTGGRPLPCSGWKRETW